MVQQWFCEKLDDCTLTSSLVFWIWFAGIVSMAIDANGENKSPDEVKGIEDEVLVERQVCFQDRELKVNAANEDERDDVATSGLQGPGMLQVHQQQQQPQGTEDEVLVERQVCFQGRELKVNASNEDERDDVATSGLQGPGTLHVHQQQQQPQGTVVYWERFLHVRSIRVLLVENDDSTRHVVTALLRNCNYEVLEAGNGLQAWKILEDLANHIDLVLTEVVMPFLSGIALLCKIMSHRTRKNIPVIMMSSHDSMGLVFNCLSKGAVDFLVKPIRKNELKNLWQHIWRRCHSSSGSGSESGTQTQKSVKSTSSQKSDNNGSDDGENNGSTGLNIGDGSDDGSGTQNSWTKQAADVDSSLAISPMDQVAECPDGTCAQVIRSNAETSDDKRVDIIVASEGHDQNRPDNDAKGKNLETIIPGNAKSKSENPMEIIHKQMGQKLKSLSDIDCNMTGKQIDHGELNPAGEHLFIKSKGCSSKISETLMEGKQSGCTGEVARTLDINNNATDDSEESNFKGSFKRLREVQDTRKSVQDDRYVLRRSEQSAFSRYNTSSNVFKAPNGITGSSSITESVKVAKRETVADLQGHPIDRFVCHKSNGNDTNIDMSTSYKPRADASSLMDKSEARSTVNSSHPSAFRPVNDLRCTKHQLLFNDIQATSSDPVKNLQQECNIQHPHNHNHHHHHNHFHYLEQPSSNHDELSQKKVLVDASQCGSINVLGGPIDSNHPKSYTLNRSASGSNHGSNGQNGSSTFIIRTNTESDIGQAGKSGSGDASGSGSGTRVDENKISQREAALSKFRQKRHERCFKKKVRYHNRKKLAEQRPRVRGQFAKQTGVDNSNRNMDENNF